MSSLKSFSTLNGFVVIGYLTAIAVIGISFYRRKTTPKEYFLGGRLISWIPAGISIIAADLSAITIMGVPAWSFQHNLELVWLSAGYPLMAPIVLTIFIPFYTSLNLYTAYEYLERRFSLNVRLLTSILFQIQRAVHVAIVIYAPALVLKLLTGLPLWECILLTGALTTVYTTLGGMKAVIYTDILQFLTVMAGLTLIFFSTIKHVHGGLEAVYQIARNHGRLRLFNLSTSPNQLTSLWSCVLGGSVLSLAALISDQAILQRLFTVRSAKDCKRSIILQAIVIMPVALLLNLVGVGLFAFYYRHPSSLGKLTSTDAILPFFAVHELLPGISGLVVAAIFAASMAVMSAGINALTTATTVDIYQRVINPGKAPEHYASVGRIGTLIWGLVVTLLALFAKDLGELIFAYPRVSSFIAGPLLGIFLLGIVTKRATAGGVLVGASASLALVCFASFFTRWSFFYLCAMGFGVTFAMGYLASLFQAPPPVEKTRGLVWNSGAERR